MFAFNPGVNDRSGEILGAAGVNAANTTANAQMKLADDIGSSLVSLAGAFGDAGELAQQGDSAYEALGALGEMYPGMKGTHGALGKLDSRTRRMAAMSILDNLGAVSQLGIAGMNDQTRQQGQMMNSPGARAAIGNQVDDAAGRTTYSPPAGLGSVVPAPSPAGFGSINQGMPGAMPMTQVNPSRRPMATRPGGR
jgi:hypothetical protein